MKNLEIMTVYYVLAGLLILVLIITLYTYKATKELNDHVESFKTEKTKILKAVTITNDKSGMDICWCGCFTCHLDYWLFYV
ncbi:MAG: hypothetical protein HC905_13140 [Bacteroidales bacterium]|nr:hypothetical protein [Bacteroidales bacterium]